MFFVAFWIYKCSHDESKYSYKAFPGRRYSPPVGRVTKCDKNIAETCVRVNPEAIYCKFLVSIKAKKPKKK